MKRQIITSLALVACMAAGAQTKMTLDLTGKNATFSLDNVSKITFSEEGMLNVFDKLGASQSFSLDEVRKSALTATSPPSRAQRLTPLLAYRSSLTAMQYV